MTPFEITVHMPGPVPLVPRTVEASSLSEALHRAAELDFAGWWPEEEDDDGSTD